MTYWRRSIAKSWLMVVVLLVYGFLAALQGAFTICLEGDGGVSVERFGSCPTVFQARPNAEAVATTQASLSGDHCGGCVDLPLLGDGELRKQATPDPAPTHTLAPPILLAWWALTPDLAPSARLGLDDATRPPAGKAHVLRSAVVLLC